MGDNRCSKDEVYDMYFWNSANPYGKYPTFSSKEAVLNPRKHKVSPNVVTIYKLVSTM